MSPKSLSGGNFIDLRSKPHELRSLNGYPVRIITYEDVSWYSVNDIKRAIGSSTDSTQSVRRLRKGGCRAKQFLLFGSTHQAWFIPLPGVQMLLLASRKLQGIDINLMIGGLEHGTL
jgi:prophage antirepressor-like protein